MKISVKIISSCKVVSEPSSAMPMTLNEVVATPKGLNWLIGIVAEGASPNKVTVAVDCAEEGTPSTLERVS